MTRNIQQSDDDANRRKHLADGRKKAEKMSNEAYMQTQAMLVVIGLNLRDMDLAGFVDRIELAEAVGPIFDPTLYNRAGRNLRELGEFARSLQLARCLAKRMRSLPQPVPATVKDSLTVEGGAK